MSFYIPVFTSPLTRFTYSGVAQSYVVIPDHGGINEKGEPYLDITFWTLPINLYKDTPEWFPALLNSGCFYLNNLVCPGLAIFFASALRFDWFEGDTAALKKCLKYLRWVFPFAMLDTLVIALFFAAPEMHLISSWVFDGNALCATLKVEGAECLVINGELLPGGWWCCAAALCTNIYVGVTMWQESKRELAEWVEDECLGGVERGGAGAGGKVEV